MRRSSTIGIVFTIALLLTGCGQTATVVDAGRGTGRASDSVVTADAGDYQGDTVDLGTMAGAAMVGTDVVLADSNVPTGFWSGSADAEGGLSSIQGPQNPVWVKAITAIGGGVFTLGARCDRLANSDPEVVCGPGTTQLWRLDAAERSWRLVAELGSGKVSGARFVSASKSVVSVLVSTFLTPTTEQVRLYDIAQDSGRVSEVDLPGQVSQPPAGAEYAVCGDNDGTRIAVVANYEQPDTDDALRSGSGSATWVMGPGAGSWDAAAEPKGVPDGRIATVGCVGSSAMLGYTSSGATWRSAVIGPDLNGWHESPVPAWMIPRVGAEPVLAVGNSNGDSIWQGSVMYTYDPVAHRWKQVTYRVPADVKAITSNDLGVFVVTAGEGAAPALAHAQS